MAKSLEVLRESCQSAGTYKKGGASENAPPSCMDSTCDPLAATKRRLAQTSDVVGQSLDLAIIQLGRDLAHGQAVLAHAVTERSELRGGVVGHLTLQARILAWNTSTVGTVATRAGGNLPVHHATTEYAFAQGGQFFVL